MRTLPLPTRNKKETSERSGYVSETHRSVKTFSPGDHGAPLAMGRELPGVWRMFSTRTAAMAPQTIGLAARDARSAAASPDGLHILDHAHVWEAKAPAAECP
jgi:hypothetical protein